MHCLAERSTARTAALLCRLSKSLYQLMQTSTPHAINDCVVSDIDVASSIEASGMWRVDGISLVLCHLDLERLHALRFLMKLSFVYCVKLADLSPLQHVKHLRTLLFSSCPKVADLTPLIECRKLEELTFSTAGRALDLKPLARCRTLQHVGLLFSKHLVNEDGLRPLADCPSLERLRLTHTRENERDEWPHLAAQCGLSHVSVAWHGPKEQGIERDSERRVELGIDDDD